MEKLVDVEEVIKEDKNKPTWFFHFEKVEGRKHGMVKLVEGKTKFQSIRCGTKKEAKNTWHCWKDEFMGGFYKLLLPCLVPKDAAQCQVLLDPMMSLHINSHFVKKRGIGKNLLITVRTVMFQEQVDMVA